MPVMRHGIRRTTAAISTMGANWVGNAVPDGTATFNASSQQTISFSQETTLGGISLVLGAGNYTFNNVNNTQLITFTGAGLVADTGASITFNNGNGLLAFSNSRRAGNATITSSNGIFFNGSS